MIRVIVSLAVGRDGAALDRLTFRTLERPEDPVEAAAVYAAAGADEIAFSSADASAGILAGLAKRAAARLGIPFWFRADLAVPSDVGALLDAGAARVAVGRAALRDPDYITTLVRSFGSERVAVVVTARREEERVWRVLEAADGPAGEWHAVTWARVVEAQGAGELVVESATPGRYGEPFDLELLAEIAAAVSVPVVAAGEAASVEDVFDALAIGDADAVLVGSLLHSGAATVAGVKAYLAERGFGPADRGSGSGD